MKNSVGFKLFILNENKIYLTQKIGDILTAVKELNDDSKNMGTRDLVRFSERIVNNIRRILHSNWSKEEKKYLLSLQKVGVAIMKAIEEKDDLPGIISSSASSLQKLVTDLGLPINKLATSDRNAIKTTDGTEKPEKKIPEQKPVAPTGDQNQTMPVNPPTDPTMQANTPPLGGETGQLNNL